MIAPPQKKMAAPPPPPALWTPQQEGVNQILQLLTEYRQPGANQQLVRYPDDATTPPKPTDRGERARSPSLPPVPHVATRHFQFHVCGTLFFSLVACCIVSQCFWHTHLSRCYHENVLSPLTARPRRHYAATARRHLSPQRPLPSPPRRKRRRSVVANLAAHVFPPPA